MLAECHYGAEAGKVSSDWSKFRHLAPGTILHFGKACDDPSMPPPITAAANRVQWLDDGPPKTESKPIGPASGFYRIIQLP